MTLVSVAMEPDPCLNCILPDCDDGDPRCPIGNEIREDWKERSRERRRSPEQRAKEYQAHKARRKTDRGRMLCAAQKRKYRQKHPETERAINARYYQANRESILRKKREDYQSRIGAE